MNFILLIIISFMSSYSFSKNLTVIEAEEFALKNTNLLKSKETSKEKSKLTEDINWKKSLPDISLQNSIDLKGSKDLAASTQGSSTLVFSEKIPWPSTWSARKEALSYQLQLAEIALEKTKLELRSSVRKIYFKIQNLKKKKINNEKSFKVIENFFAENEKRFKLGYIHSIDFERSKIQTAKQKNDQRAITSEITKFTNSLKEYLSDIDEETFYTSEIKLNSILEYLKKEKTELLNWSLFEKEIQIKVYQCSLDEKESELFPTMSVDFAYSASSNSQPKPSIGFSVNWKIFNNGSFSGYDQLERLDLLKAQQELFEEKSKQTTSYKELLADLQMKYKEYEGSCEVLQSLEKIVNSSRVRFQSGIISSFEFNQDVSDYLQGVDSKDDLYAQVIDLFLELISYENRVIVLESFI